MNPGLVVKLRPTGPWRIGPDSGARNQVDLIYHSDTLYSAVTAAMASMGSLEEWLDATARNSAGPAVSFSSCFPFQDEIGFIVPPRSVWPPQPGGSMSSAKVRWKSARFIPLGLVGALLGGQVLDEEHWAVDGPSECLVPLGSHGPFRAAMRWSAAVDRLTGVSERHSTACVEFRKGAGLWLLVSFAGESERDRWSEPVRAAFRLLADSGFGGERSRGWGRTEAPEFLDGTLPEMILPAAAEQVPRPLAPAAAVAEGAAETGEASAPTELPQPPPEGSGTAHWLLSLFTPAAADAVDWSRGSYAVVPRTGRVESAARFGDLKKQLNMVVEGSVLFAPQPVRGSAPDVAPEGFPHPVFRSGFAVSIPIPAEVAS